MSKDKERFVRTKIIPCEGYQPEPTNPRERVKVPNVGSNVKQAKSEIEIVSRNTFDPSSLSPWGETPTQQKIKDILSGMTDLLLYKNKKRAEMIGDKL